MVNCWEYESAKLRNFGWIAEEEAQSCGIINVEMSPTVVVSPISPWLFPLPLVDFNLQEMINDRDRVIAKDVKVKQYLEQNYNSVLTIFTDGSKDPETGRASAAVCSTVSS